MKDFADKLAQIPSNEDLVETMKKGMYQVLGESSTSAVIFHLGGIETLKNPSIFEEKLQSFFNGNADVILKNILKNVEAK